MEGGGRPLTGWQGSYPILIVDWVVDALCTRPVRTLGH